MKDKLADHDPIIIPYKEVNRRFTNVYGIITGSLYTYFLCLKLSNDKSVAHNPVVAALRMIN